ncbi:processed acidic surface protein [Alkalihalobacterium chitinilyticum]|uniref:Processed acidic surface protein n=1 Tax=Alkalihalobacterium chitinilyticum TaxID=2980103 RepID=A0ABT5VGD2_9BACI|nr:processed acidic surface protein [Alkalihalobacterium chitinilyticum]MDE5413503.1 processed acidic surface protein [Alkalihalobacterium chitinilyticum]
MRRALALFVIVLLICIQLPLVTLAQINKEVIEQYLSPIGWTKSDLEDYLQNYFDLSVDDFGTFQELKEWVGTPITAENRQQLLDRYNMSYDELEILLIEQGDSPQDYYFLEDLDAAIDFYLTYSHELDAVTGFFEQLGITDDELDRLFLHLSKLDEETVEAHMTTIEARLLAIGDFSNVTELTEQQKQEIASIFTDMLAALKMTATFYLKSNGQREAISLLSLLDRESLDGKILVIEFYDDEGNLLLDLSMDENIFDSQFLSDIGNMLPVLPHLAHEHPLGEKMPETASPYITNMFIGVLLSLFAAVIYTRFLRKERRRAS